MKTYFDLIKNGTEEDIVEEIVKAMEWARYLSPAEWFAITHDADSGLHGVVKRILSCPVNKN